MASEPWCSETVGERVGLGLTGGEAFQLRSRGATRGAAILLKPMAIEPVPAATAQPAHAAFPRGHVSLIAGQWAIVDFMRSALEYSVRPPWEVAFWAGGHWDAGAMLC
jgi:hypothetical protein